MFEATCPLIDYCLPFSLAEIILEMTNHLIENKLVVLRNLMYIYIPKRCSISMKKNALLKKFGHTVTLEIGWNRAKGD